jgi:caffeoyl-CoA O-methyltransferase
MISLVGEGLEAYIHDHTTPEGELFERLRAETQATLENPQMQLDRVAGQFLRIIVQITGARRVLEVGTFSGYSGLAIASALPEDGKLVTCDIDPKATALARRYFDESPWGSKIEIKLGPAKESIAALAAAGEQLDFVFIDADKSGYVGYWEAVLPLLPSGGVILADNTLWSGRVLAPQEPSDHAIVRFNAHVTTDPRVEHALLAVRDGLMLARKK